MKLLKSQCARSCVSLKGHVWTFKYFPAARCVVRVTFFVVTSSSSARTWEAQVWLVWPSRSPLTSHRSTTLSPVRLLGALLRDSHVCQVTQSHWCETHQSHWLASCLLLVGLLAGSKEDWESPPVISRVWDLTWNYLVSHSSAIAGQQNELSVTFFLISKTPKRGTKDASMLL